MENTIVKRDYSNALNNCIASFYYWIEEEDSDKTCSVIEKSTKSRLEQKKNWGKCKNYAKLPYLLTWRDISL